MRTDRHFAVVGIDGSGKSSCYHGILTALAGKFSLAGIGEKAVISGFNGRLTEPEGLNRLRVGYLIGSLIKFSRNEYLYEIGKLTELLCRSRIQNEIVNGFSPDLIITDGAPLINIMGWGRHYRPEAFNEAEYERCITYLSGGKKLDLSNGLRYLSSIPEIVWAGWIFRTSLQIPGNVIFLKVAPETALERIEQRGGKTQSHEQREFLRTLQEAYEFTLRILEDKFGVRVFPICTDSLTQAEVLEKTKEIIMSQKQIPEISVIATSISGSVKDWKKLDHLEEEFCKHSPHTSVQIVDTHQAARKKAREVLKSGCLKIVSAGGAGTFNSILEACCSVGLKSGLRLAFLRKGSADLIGKALQIPDELEPAVAIICDGFSKDRIMESDVLEVKTEDSSGWRRKYHFIGFGGVGIFGDVPFFTENRFIKYYKGFLGYLLGDRGPFIVGVFLAILKHYFQKLFGKTTEFKVIADDLETEFENLSFILIMNGDLGEHLPVAKGIPLASGDFLAVVASDLGFLKTLEQLIHSWKGTLNEQQEKLGVKIFRTTALRIIPAKPGSYFVNVDGLLRRSHGETGYRISGRVSLIRK
ncbi:MAG: diacylglycerol kinase family protein [Candidatus Wallbacteria bacterium]|nr:diacylglycerol kinase family protein [Candidatus Wallbacteria bacterium]